MTIPEDSTAILDDETTPVEQSGQDPEETSEPAIMLTPGQAGAAGMTDAMPGDTFTVKMTIASAEGGNMEATLVPGSAMKDMPEGEMEPAMRKGKQAVKGPSDMGFGDEDGFNAPAPMMP